MHRRFALFLALFITVLGGLPAFAQTTINSQGTFNTQFNSATFVSFRDIILGPAFTGSSLGQIRITVQSGNQAASPSLTLDHCQVALVGSATAPNTQLAPTEVTFASGGHGTTVNGVNGTALSDWITFAFNSGTDTMEVGCDTNTAAAQASAGANNGLGTNYNGYYKTSAADWNQATVSGYTANSGIIWVVSKIETQTSGGGGGTVTLRTLTGAGK